MKRIRARVFANEEKEIRIRIPATSLLLRAPNVVIVHTNFPAGFGALLSTFGPPAPPFIGMGSYNGRASGRTGEGEEERKRRDFFSHLDDVRNRKRKKKEKGAGSSTPPSRTTRGRRRGGVSDTRPPSS